MKLIYIITAILAVTIAEEVKKHKVFEDSEALETRESEYDLNPSASAYSQANIPDQNWNQNYVPNYPAQVWYPPSNPIKPVNSYVPPIPVSPPVQSDYIPPQNNYYPQQTWTTPSYQIPPSTTPVAVIKNEQSYGENGSYKYEYEIGDGTHVAEEGYFSDPNNQNDENLVKKGWYSYKGADGKTYTVTYWADRSGFHAYGDHLPTPPPVPAAIQQALDQNAKEEAAKAEAEKNKQPIYYPQQPQKPIYYPQQPQTPIYYPQQPQNPTQYPQQPQNPIQNPQQSQNPIQYPQQPQNSIYYPQQPSYPTQYPNYQNYGKK